MRKQRRSFFTKIAIALAVIVTSVFSFGPLFAAQGEVLRLACKYQDAKTMDPHRAVGSQDRLVVEMVFDGLVQYPAGNMKVDAIIPDLATKIPTPKLLPDGRQQWIFKLRHGVMTQPYPGGSPYELTSEDVVYSLNRAANPKWSAFAVNYDGMNFKALDKYTVQVTVDKPLSSFLFLPKFANRSGGLIVPKKVIEAKGEEWFKTHPVGTGPFIFKKYIPGEKVVFTANKNYFKGAPKLAGVELYYMPSENSREMGLRKGELDVIEGPKEQAWGQKMEGIRGVKVEYVGGAETLVAHFNMSVKPLNLLKVRQAIAYAISRKEFLAVYGTKVAAPIYGCVPVGKIIAGLSRKDAKENGVLYEHNLKKAKKLLAEAGYSKGFSLNLFTSQSTTYRRAYELLQAELRKIGIKVNLSVIEHATFHERIRQNLDPIVFYSCMRPDPDVILTQFYYSESIVKTGKKPVTNFSHIGAVDANGNGKIDSIDSLILRARAEQNSQEQVALWKKAQVDLLKVVASYPVITVGNVFAESPKVNWGFKMKFITDDPLPNEATQIMK